MISLSLFLYITHSLSEELPTPIKNYIMEYSSSVGGGKKK